MNFNFNNEAFDEQLGRLREIVEQGRERFDDIEIPGAETVSSFIDNIEVPEAVSSFIETGKGRFDEAVEPVAKAAEERVQKGAEVYTSGVESLQERSLEGVDTIGEQYVGFVKAAAERLPNVELPFIKSLPALDAQVADGFDFANSMIQKQKHYTVKAIEAFLPVVTPAKPAAAPKAGAAPKKTTTKRAAKKAPARKKAAAKA